MFTTTFRYLKLISLNYDQYSYNGHPWVKLKGGVWKPSSAHIKYGISTNLALLLFFDKTICPCGMSSAIWGLFAKKLHASIYYYYYY